MNNGKYHTVEYKQKQQEKANRLFGAIEEHIKSCKCCRKEFVFKGRLNTKAYERANFCSRSCANNRKSWWKDNATGYRSIAFQHHEKECVVCGFNKIVAVHHIDENRSNNHPSNLIPLCPNHHEMVHSKWKEEIAPYIEEWQKQWAGS